MPSLVEFDKALPIHTAEARVLAANVQTTFTCNCGRKDPLSIFDVRQAVTCPQCRKVWIVLSAELVRDPVQPQRSGLRVQLHFQEGRV
jgi:hypothetical protein